MNAEPNLPDDDEDAERGERIAKWLARAGVASRRDAEKMIAEGRVKVDGKVIGKPATFILPGMSIMVDNKVVAGAQRTRLFRYHKPVGLVTTRRDGRPQLSPVSCGVDPDGRVLVATYPERAKAANVRRDGRVVNLLDAESTIRSVAIASGLGASSAYTWLKLPVVDDLPRVMDATTLPTLLLGGDPDGDPHDTYALWGRALDLPAVRGLVVGRALLYPPDGDVAAAVDTAVGLL